MVMVGFPKLRIGLCVQWWLSVILYAKFRYANTQLLTGNNSKEVDVVDQRTEDWLAYLALCKDRRPGDWLREIYSLLRRPMADNQPNEGNDDLPEGDPAQENALQV
jgi:hypothetical protein